MAVVPGRHLDQVGQNPTQTPPVSVTADVSRGRPARPWSPLGGCGRTQLARGRAAHRDPRARRCGTPSLGLAPMGTGPGLPFGATQEAELDPVVLDQCEVLEQPCQGECRCRNALAHAVGAGVVRLAQQRRPLVVKELVQTGPPVDGEIGSRRSITPVFRMKRLDRLRRATRIQVTGRADR